MGLNTFKALVNEAAVSFPGELGDDYLNLYSSAEKMLKLFKDNQPKRK